MTTLAGVTAKERVRAIVKHEADRRGVGVRQLAVQIGRSQNYFAGLFGKNRGKNLELLDRVAELVSIPIERFIAPELTSTVTMADDHAGGETTHPEVTGMPEINHKAASLAHEFMDVPAEQRLAAWDEAVAMFRRRSQACAGSTEDHAEGDL